MQISAINNYNKTSFGHGAHSDAPQSLKRKVFLTSLAGVGIATAIISKRQGFSLSPKKIFKTKPKDWAIFKFKGKKLKYETPEILTLGAASVAGGFLGGVLFDDKKNLKAKAKESLNQFAGNILIPISIVGVASKYYADKKYGKLDGNTLQTFIENHMPQLKNSTKKAAKYVNSFMKGLPTVAVTGIALGVGIIAGNKVSNFINEKLYKKKVDRDVKVSDFAPHLDDVCYASSLMAPNNTFFSAVSRLVPLMLAVPGLQTGIAQDN